MISTLKLTAAALFTMLMTQPAIAQKRGVFDPGAPRLTRVQPSSSDSAAIQRIVMNPITPKGVRHTADIADVTAGPDLVGTFIASKSRKSPHYVLGDGTEIYGSLIYSNQWSGTAGAFGIYKFPASTYSMPELVYNQGSYDANGGGCFDGTKYYWNSYVYTEEMGFTFTTFCSYDFTTHEFNKNILSFINDNFDLQQITNALTYDATEGKIYALANIKVVDETGWIERYYPALSEIDAYTGFATPIAQIPSMIALAASPGGELFAISQGSDATLYRINKSNGDCIRIGSTGLTADFAQSMAFDPITGKLYWAAIQQNGRSGLYEVDTNTGRASLIFNFANNEEFTGLYIPAPTIASDAPAVVESISGDFDKGSLSGNFTIKAPSKTHSGSTLSGNIILTIITDGDATETKSITPGQSVTIQRTLTEGVHSLTVYASNDKGDGARKTLSKYIGIDAPAAVSNLTATPTQDGKAHISWTAPVSGRHDGYIDPAQLTYTVIRMPDEVTVAEGITATYFTDPVNVPAANFAYKVIAYCGGRKGVEATTDAKLYGQGSNLPVSFGFESKEAFDLFTVIDANNDWDGEYKWGGWMYGPEFTYAVDQGNCAVYGYHPDNAADDWLITPPVTVEQGKKYRVTFKLWTKGDKETVAVTAGPRNTVAGQSVILAAAEYNHKDKREMSADFTATESGNYYVGFHITSPKKKFYCFVSDIVVDIIPDTDAPQAVQNLKAIADASGANKAVITFAAPTKTIGGQNLSSLDKIEIYHGNEESPVHTAYVTPGANYSWTDNNVFGFVNYRVVAYARGKAGEKAEAKVYVGWDTPVAVSNLAVSDITGKPVISWTAPDKGANGGYIDSSKLTYNIYRFEDDLELIESNVSGTTFTDNDIDGSTIQHLVAYLVTAKSPAGNSEPATTDYIVYGEPYVGEFTESFSDATVHSTPWVMYRLKGQTQNWGVASYGTNPYAEPVDGDGGLAAFGINGRVGDEGLLVSPKLNLSSFSAPTLSFYFYHNYTDEHAAWDEGFEDRLIPEVMLSDESRVALSEPIYVDDLGTGWLKYSCDLSAYRNQPYVRIALHGITACEQDVYVDLLQVTNLISNDLQAYAFTGNGRVEGGKTATYKLTVFNRGAANVPANAYNVKLYDGSNVVTTLPGVAIASKEYYTFIFNRTYSEEESGTTHDLQAVIEWDEDEVPGNNASQNVTTEVVMPPMPEVRNLAANVNDNNVTLSWGKPDGHHVEEGFEEHVPYEISDFGGYILVDGDGNMTWGFSNVYFENSGEPQSFMVFNPVALGIVEMANSLFPYDCFDPHNGNQVLACFQGYTVNAQGNAVSATNNDWFISPEVFGGQTITFYAKSGDQMQGIDKFEVMYSTTGTDTQSFKQLSQTISTNQNWEKHEFTLPADARYFAIHCVSEDGFILFIDDLQYVERRESTSAELTGYELYRDGIKLTELPATATTFSDNALADGNYTYHIIAVYNNGRKSATSNKVTVKVGLGGVDNAINDTLKVRTEGETITIINPDGGEVSVTSADGKVIYRATGENHNLQAGKGVFIIRAGGQSKTIIL